MNTAVRQLGQLQFVPTLDDVGGLSFAMGSLIKGLRRTGYLRASR